MARFLAVTVRMLLVLALWAFLKARMIPSWNDLPRDEDILSRLLEDTRYSDSFTETGFSRIRPGMTKDSVSELVGQPLEILRKSDERIVEILEYRKNAWQKRVLDPQRDLKITAEIYYYSRPGTRTEHWYVRAVTFSSEGIVESVGKSFYFD